MGRSQLQYNRRARGRRGGAGSGRGGEGGRSSRASSRVKGLPSNEFRFQQQGGGDEGKPSSRRGEESDDLRAYTLGGDLNASRPQPAESKGGEDEEELSSLVLDLFSLAQGLLTLPVHERLGVDRAYTEGLEYRDGIGRDVGDEGGPAAHSRKEAEEEEEEKKEQIMRPVPPPAVGQVRQVMMDESASLVDSSLEALLGLEISDKGEGQGGKGITASTGSRQPTAASPASSSAATNDLLDDLLALDAGIESTGGGGKGGGGAMSNTSKIRTASSSSTKKTSMLDDGGY